MNFDELMAVWKSQDAAPLHDVNQTLLHQALRQDEAKLRKEWRRDKRLTYGFGLAIIAGMAFALVLVSHARERYLVTVWDYAVGIAGVAAALISIGAMYRGHRAQTRREQRFGESLRDQINRRIAQLDDAATEGHRRDLLVLVTMGLICPVAILYISARVNDQPVTDVLYLIIAVIVWSLWSGTTGFRRRSPRGNLLVLILMGAICATGIAYLSSGINSQPIGSPPYLIIVPLIWFQWAVAKEVRRSVQQNIERKRRLEELLKELDGQ